MCGDETLHVQQCTGWVGWLGWAGLGWAGLGWLGWLADVQCYSAQPSTMWLIVHMNTS